MNVRKNAKDMLHLAAGSQAVVLTKRREKPRELQKNDQP